MASARANTTAQRLPVHVPTPHCFLLATDGNLSSVCRPLSGALALSPLVRLLVCSNTLNSTRPRSPRPPRCSPQRIGHSTRRLPPFVTGPSLSAAATMGPPQPEATETGTHTPQLVTAVESLLLAVTTPRSMCGGHVGNIQLSRRPRRCHCFLCGVVSMPKALMESASKLPFSAAPFIATAYPSRTHR